MGRDAGSREGGEGCTEPGDMPTCRASVKTSGGPKPARREGYAGIGSPAPTIPASLEPWFKFQFLHLFLHDAGQVTSLGSQNLSFLIQLNVSNKGYYLLSLYSSPEQATKSMPKTFFSPSLSFHSQSSQDLSLPGFTMGPPPVSMSLCRESKGP